MAEITLGNLYDFNKSAMAQFIPLDTISFNRETESAMKEIYKKAKSGNCYWMLLNNERKDYTVFIIETFEGSLDEFRPTLLNRGQVLSIDKQEDENYEIWIRDPETKENFVYYLFDYSFGIIKA